MIRARIFRDGPGAWAFSIVDADGLPFVTGDAYSWGEARDKVVEELMLFAERDQPPAWVIPIVPAEPPLISPEARERSWLARLLCPAVSEAA
jgi:hypothetical protein